MDQLDGSKAYILSKIKTALHEAVSLDVLFQIQDDLLELTDAERMTLYACDQTSIELVSRVRTGSEVPEIRVSANFDSIAGFCVSTQQIVNVSDAYDTRELTAFDKRLKFDQSWDKKTGFRTQQVLCAPIIYAGKYILGALQVLNCKGTKYAFTEQDELLTEKVCESLALTIQKYVTAPADDPVPEDSRDKILEMLRQYKIPMPAGAAKAVEKLILENQDFRERLRKYKSVFDGLD